MSWGYIYEHPDSDPIAHRHVLDVGARRTLLVPVPAAADAAPVARQLVAEDVGLIELCGGSSLGDAARVAEA